MLGGGAAKTRKFARPLGLSRAGRETARQNLGACTRVKTHVAATRGARGADLRWRHGPRASSPWASAGPWAADVESWLSAERRLHLRHGGAPCGCRSCSGRLVAAAAAARRSGRGVEAARRHDAVGRLGWRADGGELSRCAAGSRAASLAAGQPSGGSRQHAESAARLRAQKRAASAAGSAASRRRLRRRAAASSWAGCSAAFSGRAARSEPASDGPRGRRAGGSRWRCRSRRGAAWAERRRQPSPHVAGCELGRGLAAATAAAAAESIAAASGGEHARQGSGGPSGEPPTRLSEHRAAASERAWGRASARVCAVDCAAAARTAHAMYVHMHMHMHISWACYISFACTLQAFPYSFS